MLVARTCSVFFFNGGRKFFMQVKFLVLAPLLSRNHNFFTLCKSICSFSMPNCERRSAAQAVRAG